jgi:hypothetical protein
VPLVGSLAAAVEVMPLAGPPAPSPSSESVSAAMAAAVLAAL